MALSSLYAVPCASQSDPLEETWRWVKFTSSSGLPSNNVRDIKDGPSHTPWAWTSGGLAWYDGFQWHTVAASRCFAEQGSGFVGFYGERAVLSIRDRVYLATRTSLQPLPMDSVDGVWTVGNDSILISRNRTLHSYADGVLRVVPIPSVFGGAQIIYPLSSRRLLCVKTDRFLLWNGTRCITLLRTPRNSIGDTYFSENAGGRGIFLVGHPASLRGCWEWEPDGTVRRNPFRTVRNALGTHVAENGDAIVLYENDLIRARRNNTWRTIRPPSSVRDIQSIRFRSNGDLWVSTLHGLFLCALFTQPWTFHQWRESDPRNRVNNILRAHDGSLWLATTGGIVRVRPDGSSVTFSRILGARIDVVTGLVEDRDGGIWISSGSGFAGAYRWDGRAWHRYPILYRGEGVYVHNIVRDSNGRLWFLGLTGVYNPRSEANPGVFLYDGGEIHRWSESDKLPHQRVFSCAEGPDGALWFGTHGGLARWGNGAWTVWKSGSGPIRGAVTALAVDRGNRVWFGMRERAPGVGMIEGTGAPRYFLSTDGLPGDRVSDVKVDARDRIWVTTQKGLACYDGGNWLTFDERSGLHEPQLWPVLPEDSVIIAGTLTSGWAELRLARTEEDNPRVEIHQPVIEENHGVIGWSVHAFWGNVSPENILTRYRINKGAWSEWSTTHTLLLHGPGAGDYVLQVQAKGLYGQYDEQGKTLAFTVHPPLERRWYFYIPAGLAVVVIFVLAALLYQRRRKFVRALGRSEERYRMITELMSDYAYLYHVRDDATLDLVWMTDSFTRLSGYAAQEANEPDFMQRYIHPDDLEQALGDHRKLLAGETIHIEHRVVTRSGKALWIERRSSPVYDKEGTRVEYIYGVVHDITARKESEQRLRSLAGELVKTEERERRRMATFLHDVIGQALTLSYLKLHRWQRKERPGDQALDEIRGILDQIMKDAHSLTFELCPPIIYELSLGDALGWLASRLEKQHGVVIETDFTEEKLFVAQELHVLLFQAVRELLVNSIKHADAEHRIVELHRSNGMVRILVVDDGVGFDPGTSEMYPDKEGGFGLFNIRERLSDFGVSLDIDSASGKGTRITITARLDDGKNTNADTPIAAGDRR